VDDSRLRIVVVTRVRSRAAGPLACKQNAQSCRISCGFKLYSAITIM